MAVKVSKEDWITKRFQHYIDQLVATRKVKGHDYGNSKDSLHNLRAATDMGMSAFEGVALRMSDKMSRIKTYVRHGELRVKDDSIRDSLKDIAVYAILGQILLDEEGEENGHGLCEK